MAGSVRRFKLFVHFCDSPSSVGPLSARVNLGRAMKLRELEVMSQLYPPLVLATLQTVARNHQKLQRITLRVVHLEGFDDREGVGRAIGETTYRQWLELDRHLARLRESQSIRLRALCDRGLGSEGSKEESRMKILLPEVMTGGVVDLV